MTAYSKQQVINQALAEVKAALEFWLKDDVQYYPHVEVQQLEPYQSMHWRGEIEIFKPDSDEIGDVELEYN